MPGSDEPVQCGNDESGREHDNRPIKVLEQIRRLVRPERPEKGESRVDQRGDVDDNTKPAQGVLCFR